MFLPLPACLLNFLFKMALESEMGNSRQNSESRYPELNKNYSIFVGPQPQRQPQ